MFTSLSVNVVNRTVGNRSFWDVCPQYFHDRIDDMKDKTDYIHMFLTLAPGENVYSGKDVYFRYRKGAKMQLQDFKTQFLNYKTRK